MLVCLREESNDLSDKIEFGLRFACLIFGVGHHATLTKMGERDENRLRGHSADRWTAISGKLAHLTRLERVTFAFGDLPAHPVPVTERKKWFATSLETLFASMIPNARVCQSKWLILLERGITTLSASWI